ncbi:hypothetical protein NSTC745_02743 [Nostoc sp. DSM 114161]|uniref:hypothetical protein n=1 Tax=Nostoc sp. DSM 114161 TaxID=3440143 RepID=UPI00404604FD
MKTLIITSGYVQHFINIELPGLEYINLKCRNSARIHIQLGINNQQSDISRLRRFGNFFPQLRYLGLRGSAGYNTIVSHIVDSDILNRLVVLDLSDGDLGDIEAETLLNSPAINCLHTLNVSKNCLSPAMVKKLYQLKCKVIAEPQKA